MLPQPRSMPRVVAGHGAVGDGQKVLVRVQIWFIAGWLHSRRMCSSDSGEALQLAHLALCSKVGMLFQKSPILSAPLMALKRKV